MKSILLAVLFSSGVWAADEVADRAAIEKTIAALSVAPVREDLFTADFDGRAEMARLVTIRFPVVCPEVWGELCGAQTIPITVGGQPGELVISKAPWGEAILIPPGMSLPVDAGAPVIVVKKIRFLTPEVAMVDAVGRSSLLIVLKKYGTDWKIASLRILAEK
jgi:hypothetical protein